jgi:hypothetical protein
MKLYLITFAICIILNMAFNMNLIPTGWFYTFLDSNGFMTFSGGVFFIPFIYLIYKAHLKMKNNGM